MTQASNIKFIIDRVCWRQRFKQSKRPLVSDYSICRSWEHSKTPKSAAGTSNTKCRNLRSRDVDRSLDAFNLLASSRKHSISISKLSCPTKENDVSEQSREG